MVKNLYQIVKQAHNSANQEVDSLDKAFFDEKVPLVTQASIGIVCYLDGFVSSLYRQITNKFNKK